MGRLFLLALLALVFGIPGILVWTILEWHRPKLSRPADPDLVAGLRELEAQAGRLEAIGRDLERLQGRRPPRHLKLVE